MTVLLTVILQVASAFLIFTAMEAFPAFLAVTLPLELTEAILELLEENEGFFPFEVNAVSKNSSPIFSVLEYLPKIMKL